MPKWVIYPYYVNTSFVLADVGQLLGGEFIVDKFVRKVAKSVKIRSV